MVAVYQSRTSSFDPYFDLYASISKFLWRVCAAAFSDAGPLGLGAFDDADLRGTTEQLHSSGLVLSLQKSRNTTAWVAFHIALWRSLHVGRRHDILAIGGQHCLRPPRALGGYRNLLNIANEVDFRAAVLESSKSSATQINPRAHMRYLSIVGE